MKIDREEFEKRLNSIFKPNSYFYEKFIECLILEDKEGIKACREQHLKNKQKIEKYLNDWDNSDDKESVVSSVKLGD